ncbi:MAG: hypothetical protein A3A80_03610 [Candidatus Terrybacteria bacterium RIFCSPLOWO2_01_FULL_44_24]|uniref:Uncharacterized protein n=1 Tax=Candidatus Terrybacteria bacterium RIFCSPHIGHO2_01_FULL_43_35 TaxID=1802361 RepID=A0A1G2PDK6_9BACT|nr:MAG: hypothetical protein A2828_00530 [Candidatus Terrybacteria bacterium RIFCSPHIGHO2_01_FULL_43_35]OHA49769.1 MAG: hypothetical protein A3B75_02105 [Candidatus Terrybacteria bacterium RIFCSPHIGHO2_02_FULL_43_14]OHA51591.1 MAG: hypothetical protein A3A80_03610 [Candidatus Terrybacteria bacterium RIFCSPLOWO2_01_FULL_44_24]
MFNHENAFKSAEMERVSGATQERVLEQEAEGGVLPYLKKEFGDNVWTDTVDRLRTHYEGPLREAAFDVVLGEGAKTGKNRRKEIASTFRDSTVMNSIDLGIKKLVGGELNDRFYFSKAEYAYLYAIASGDRRMDKRFEPMIQEILRIAIEDQLAIIHDPKRAKEADGALNRAADFAAQYRVLFGDKNPLMSQEDRVLLLSVLRQKISEGLSNREELKPTIDDDRHMIQSYYDPKTLAIYRILNAHRLNFGEGGLEVIDRPPAPSQEMR